MDKIGEFLGSDLYMQDQIDYLQSDKVLIVIENSIEKVFHRIDYSFDLNNLQEVANMLKEEHDQENILIKKHGRYELFTYPIIGNGADANFKR